MAEMPGILSREPPALDSRLRGNDGCARVSLRGNDGCSKVSERGNPSPTGCATMTPGAVRHAGRPSQVGNLGSAVDLPAFRGLCFSRWPVLAGRGRLAQFHPR